MFANEFLTFNSGPPILDSERSLSGELSAFGSFFFSRTQRQFRVLTITAGRSVARAKAPFGLPVILDDPKNDFVQFDVHFLNIR